MPPQSFVKIVDQFENLGEKYFEENLIKVSETQNTEALVRKISSFNPIPLKTQEKRQTTQSEKHEIEKILRGEIGIILKKSRSIPFSDLDFIKKDILTRNLRIDEVSGEFHRQISNLRKIYQKYFATVRDQLCATFRTTTGIQSQAKTRTLCQPIIGAY